MEVKIGHTAAGDNRLLIIAGPCVIESEELTLHTAEKLKEFCAELNLSFVFKSSFDKANRSSLDSYRGLGIEKGLEILATVREKVGVPVTSDIHSIEQIKPASEVLDLLQIPALLCRQTDLILSASSTGLPVNIKKGQFMAPWDIKNIADKFVSTGNRNLLITERGTCFGYNNLVVDYRAFPIMKSLGFPIIFDVTHSLQLPGGRGKSSGGQREFAEPLALAAAAAGVEGLFMEVHPDPEKALCDGPNMIPIGSVRRLLKTASDIHNIIHSAGRC